MIRRRSVPPRVKRVALFALLVAFLAGGVALRFVLGPYTDGPRMLGLDGSADGRIDPICVDSGNPSPGQPLSELLTERGVSPGDANEFLPRLSALMDLRRTGARDEVRLHSDRNGLLTRLEYHPRGGSAAGTFFVVSRDSTGIRAWREAEPLTPVFRKYGGQVRGSLFASMTREGIVPTQVDEFCDIFSCDVDFFTATREGDRWEMLTEELIDAEGNRVRPGRLLGGRYVNVDTPYEAFYYAPQLADRLGAERDGVAPDAGITQMNAVASLDPGSLLPLGLSESAGARNLFRRGTAILPHGAPAAASPRLPSDGAKGAFYRADGESLRRAFLKAPLTYRRISSGYTQRRLHPIFNVVRPHLGVDYAAPYGTPVMAVADGVVQSAGWMRGYGKLLRIAHRDGIVTYSAHLSRFAGGIRAGQTVRQGDVVGYVGMTGNATGPHLDFRIERDGQFIDPLRFRSSGGEPLAAAERASFFEMVGGYRQALARLDGGGYLSPREFAALLPANGGDARAMAVTEGFAGAPR